MISYYHLSSKDTPVLDIYLHITTCLWMTHRPPRMSYYHLPSKDTPASVSVMGWWCTILTPAFHWHTGPRHSKLYPQLTTCHPETHRPLTSIYTYIHSYTPSNNMLCIHYHMSWKDTPAFDINMHIHITDWCWMTHRPSTFTHNDNDVTSYMTYMTTRNAKTHRPPATSYAFILPPFILRHTGLRRPNVPPHITTSHPKTHLHITGA